MTPADLTVAFELNVPLYRQDGDYGAEDTLEEAKTRADEIVERSPRLYITVWETKRWTSGRDHQWRCTMERQVYEVHGAKCLCRTCKTEREANALA